MYKPHTFNILTNNVCLDYLKWAAKSASVLFKAKRDILFLSLSG